MDAASPPVPFLASLPQPRGAVWSSCTLCHPSVPVPVARGRQTGSRPAVTPNQKDDAGRFSPALTVTGCRASGAVIYHASP